MSFAHVFDLRSTVSYNKKNGVVGMATAANHYRLRQYSQKQEATKKCRYHCQYKKEAMNPLVS